jgi:hypothetical protein
VRVPGYLARSDRDATGPGDGPAAGERVTGTAVAEYEPAGGASRLAAGAAHRELTMLRRRSARPSRRAVLHVQAPGDPPPAPGLQTWYTERAFHFYVTGIRLPSQAPVGARPRARYLATALADLDAARGYLLADGMASVIVTATGRGAIAAALWHDQRKPAAADALILDEPVLPPGISLSLDVGCPVLVLTGADACVPAVSRPFAWRRRRPAGSAPDGGLRLGGHVTWLRLPGAGSGDPDRAAYFGELGRWLGAYMYGSVRDQLL